MAKEKDDEIIDRGDFLGEDDEYEELDTLGDEDLDEEEVDDDADENFDTENEEDSEADEEFEEEEDESTSDEDPSPKSRIRIPKDRFDEVIAQRDYERRQNEQLMRQMEELMSMVKGGKEPKEEPKKEEFVYDFDSKESEYMEAVLEGDTSKAASIRREIRAAEQKFYEQNSDKLRESAVTEARTEAKRLEEESRFNSTVSAIEGEYTFLKQGSKDYNQAAVDKINGLFARFVKAGNSKADAIQEAVELVAPSYVPKGKDGISKGEGLGGNKERRGLKKNIRAAQKQPPKLPNGKARKDKRMEDYDLTTMSEKEFSELPASVKRKLRGD